jgi:hypothetical protein
MIRLATRFGQHRGIVTVMSLVVGDLQEHHNLDRQMRRNQVLLDEGNMIGFCEVIAVPDLLSGVLTVSQANGFAGLDSNTILFGWPERPESLQVLLGVVRRLDMLQKCSLIYRHCEDISTQISSRQIIVWWTGRENNGDLMLLLAHLLRGNKGWADSQIVLKSVVSSHEAATARRAEFTELLPEIRITAQVDVVVAQKDEVVFDLIRRHSQGASLVFLGLASAEDGNEEKVAAHVQAMVRGLPSTLLVRNSGPFRGRLV